MRKYGVGVIGCGRISHTYLTNITEKFSILRLVGVADLLPERSEAKAAQFGVRKMTNEEIYASDEVDIVVNLTYPMSHYEVTKAALEAGKHVYCEKMMAVTMAEADELMALAAAKGLSFVIAPDTFLGGGLQTCRKLVDAGMIGEPRSALAMIMRGTELLDIVPENNRMVLLPGGGIPFDMGGYYLAALINMLGGIRRVGGFAQKIGKPFVNVNNPSFGKLVEIDTPNLMAGVLEFQSGCVGNLIVHSEGFALPQRLEVHGTEGVLVCPDPNTFGGPVQLYRKSTTLKEPLEIPLTHGFTEGCNRGLGLADLAWALEKGRAPRLQLGYHCFEAIHGIWQSGETGELHTMRSAVSRPAPLPSGYVDPAAREAALAL